MDKYTVPKQEGGSRTLKEAGRGQVAEGAIPSETSLGSIMAAIQYLKGTLEPKLDAVTVDVTLQQADLKKVVEKVTTAEMDIAHLQSTSKRLEDQVQFLTTGYERMVAHLEDQDGRA
ncbi:hypothetical protein NDU88_002913 [Pleurodeles waltl]|uniref:Uncharacterized protein n=1 Tax=Pleurodeles waltl TaxID=8319 RepID=A0AAV7KV25_PLEWA|nr:hypothetical protein NDU88_002913 [Pleurodeles waltl]